MKYFFTLLALSFTLSITGLTHSYAVNNDELVGEWEVVQTMNTEDNVKRLPKAKIYYQFLEDGTMVMTDMGFRERSTWLWRLKGNRLSIQSQVTGKIVSGNIKLYSQRRTQETKDIVQRFAFTYSTYETRRIDGGKSKRVKTGTYTWVFEK